MAKTVEKQEDPSGNGDGGEASSAPSSASSSSPAPAPAEQTERAESPVEERESHDRESMPVDAEEPPRLPFPVVGVGASAGGLPAFQEFFRSMPADSGMAFVLIQHLPPDRESMIAEILQRTTKMSVRQVEEGVRVEPNRVYVIRPGHTLTIRDGVLHLGEKLEKPRHSRPVDDFFKSLAEEQRERAICIIMSGMGSNGTAGAQAVKAVGGLCIAQDPESAEFPSMPRHLIEAGYADHVLRPREMPEVLLGYAGHPYTAGGRSNGQAILRREQQNFREVLAILRTRTHQDFSGYKQPTILRRIQRRMGLNRVEQMGEYARLLRQTPAEVSALADDMMIHVTGFFRDAEAWEALRQRVVVPLVANRGQGDAIRCWVTACSSGEEAYTLAMLLVEESERAGKQLDIKIFATDMAERTLQNARNGVYPGGIESEMPPERLERFFEKEDAIYRVRRHLRELVVFAPQNVLQDPPFSRLDIATCRNLLIYLEPEVQRRVLSLLHFGLREGGALFLGTSETIAGMEEMFEPLDKRWRLYRRVGPTRHGLVDFPLPRVVSAPGELPRQRRALPPMRPTLAQMTHQALLERHTPAAVTVDRDFRVVYYHGNTTAFLFHPSGEPTRDLLSLVREGVRGPVRAALQRASSRGGEVRAADGWIDGETGCHRVVVAVTPLESKAESGYFVVSFSVHEQLAGAPGGGFAQHATEAGKQGQALVPQEELRRVRDELQSTIEELQSSNEELKASQEELTSINEELQSTNEELETSKEEMQSLNEELTTVNAQLQAKMEEHQATSNDLGSVLSSTDIAVIFLDSRFRVRRFTPAMRNLVEFIPSDVGRPVSDLAQKFRDPHLMSDARAVLERLVPVEREIAADDGRWFMRRVLPYRTTDNRIDGVVITFVETTQRKRTEQALAERARLLDLSNDAIMVADAGGRIIYWNHGAATLYGWSAADAIGKNLEELLRPETDVTLEEVTRELREKDQLTKEAVHVTRDGRRVPVLCRWALDRDAEGRPGAILMTTTDITVRKRAEELVSGSEARLRRAFGAVDVVGVLFFDNEGRLVDCNDAFLQIEGIGREDVAGGKLRWTDLTPPEWKPRSEQAWAEMQATGRTTPYFKEYSKKDGSRWWGLFAAARIDAETIVEYVIDVTASRRDEDVDRAELLARERAARAEAESANQMKDEFLAMLSHELRTPLSAILLWSKMLQTRQIPPGQQGEALHAIITSAEAQRELVETLLDTARISSGKLRLALREVALLPLVREAMDAIMPTADVKSVRIEAASVMEDVGVVAADPDRLRQVVWNLLTNSVKFTPPGGRIEVGLSRHGHEVELTVRDTGRGIEPAFVPHLFRRFQQGGAGRSAHPGGGLGLGLAISKQIVELHGGTITAQSDGAGKGATFRVRLPLPRVGSLMKVGRAPRTAVLPLKGVHVLLVEDDDATRNALTKLLIAAGAEVTSAASGATALDAFGRQPPDVIVSDIGMAGMDGYELLDEIRKQEKAASQPATPAVALTALAQERDRERAMRQGYQAHVVKPPDPQRLVEVIGRLVKAK